MPAAPQIHTIPLSQLELAAYAAKLRRHHGGRRIAQMCALTPGPLHQFDCGQQHPALRLSPAWRRTQPYFGPLQRGHIAHLFERVRRQGGLAEVRRTWGTGIKTLRAEPRHVLNGAIPAQAR